MYACCCVLSHIQVLLCTYIYVESVRISHASMLRYMFVCAAAVQCLTLMCVLLLLMLSLIYWKRSELAHAFLHCHRGCLCRKSHYCSQPSIRSNDHLLCFYRRICAIAHSTIMLNLKKKCTHKILLRTRECITSWSFDRKTLRACAKARISMSAFRLSRYTYARIPIKIDKETTHVESDARVHRFGQRTRALARYTWYWGMQTYVRPDLFTYYIVLELLLRGLFFCFILLL